MATHRPQLDIGLGIPDLDLATVITDSEVGSITSPRQTRHLRALVIRPADETHVYVSAKV